MKYLIMRRSEKGIEEIAEFRNEVARNICLKALQSEFPDVDMDEFEFIAATGG